MAAEDEKKFPVLTGAHGWQVEVKGAVPIQPFKNQRLR